MFFFFVVAVSEPFEAQQTYFEETIYTVAISASF